MALNIIPNSGQSLDQTRDGIRQNFSVIDTSFSVDHVPYNSPAPNEGKHNKVTFPPQAGDPVLVANEMALFTKLVGGNPALFLSDFNTSTVVDFTTATKANTGSLTLPCGIIVKWGRNTTSGGGSGVAATQTVTFATAFPNAIFTAYAAISVIGGSPSTSEANSSLARIYNYSTTQIQVATYRNSTTRPGQVSDYVWLAIGY